jgi:hypothetical protein
MCKRLKFDPSTIALDTAPGIQKIKNFKGPLRIDFGTAAPDIDWNDDEQIAIALESCIRKSRMDDRTTRTVPREFKEYHAAGKFDLARAIYKAMTGLVDSDPQEAVVQLSDGAKAALIAAAEHHPMVQHIFYEAHLDWDSALMQLRLVIEPFKCPPLCQSASMIDDGRGSTGKGTTRELIELGVGVYTGREQLGYSCTLNVETLASKKQEGPTEQTANMFLCSHAFIDDFSPREPLNNVTLRQLTGGNNLKAARKSMPEFVFKFYGQLFLFTNG